MTTLDWGAITISAIVLIGAAGIIGLVIWMTRD
jgi:hypothetical protein